MNDTAKPTATSIELSHAQLLAALVEVLGEGARHRRHRQPERELGRRAPVGAEQHGADTMVAPERDTPGIIDTHCARPMPRYIGNGNSVAS